MSNKSVVCEIEKMVIPTFVPPVAEEMPMYSEFRQHQGSTGYAYPNKITVGVERNIITEKEYSVVKLENDYIRLIILPELGGRIWEGYDKTSDYYFLYRNSYVKPVIVGSYGSFVGGGMEFNFPFHHRPSTFMPVDYTVEYCDDGSVIVWLSESTPSPGQYRMRSTHGIKMRKETSYFETIVKLDNRTPVKHPFLWWENCGVHVNDDYQLFFPQDVNYIHHHYDRHHMTFPIAEGYYAVEKYELGTDISIQKNNQKGNSLFAGPSKFDFFGGYDHQKDCGTVHFADHHITPGKKMFLWGKEELGNSWNENMAGTDGNYAELMAGSYTDDQPDFSYIAPFEVKSFSQFWYPIHKVKVPTFANLNAIVSLDRTHLKSRIAVTTAIDDARFIISLNGNPILDEVVSLNPSDCKEYSVNLTYKCCTIQLIDKNGTVLLDYTEEHPDGFRIPQDNMGVPSPNELESAQEIYIAGQHMDLYRDPLWKGKEYYEVALQRHPDYIPALLEMAEYCYNHAYYEKGIQYLETAESAINKYNKNPSDGTCSYLKALCQFKLGNIDDAYEIFYKAAWSNNVVSPSMTYLSAIDGQRKDYENMKRHAQMALSKESFHALCHSYLAIAEYNLGNTKKAVDILSEKLKNDKLDHLARFLYYLYSGTTLKDFYSLLNSNPSQTCLDITFNLLDAGQYQNAVILLEGLKKTSSLSTLGHYTLANIYDMLGDSSSAIQNRNKVCDMPFVDTFPYRLEEINVLKNAVCANADDYTAAYLLGCILYDKTHFESAVDCFKAAIKIKPDFYIPYRNLAIAYYSKMDRKQDALDLLITACKIKKNDDSLVKETNYVMAKLGIDGKERLEFLLENIPENPSDNLVWDLADAYSNVFKFQNAIDELLNHTFIAAECQETYLTEAYTFAMCAKGRLLRQENRMDEALDCFRNAQIIPKNFNAGWWDKQALYYAICFEAETLQMMGRLDEARKVAGQLIPFIHSGYSPYMGPETDYYVSVAYRILGNELMARTHLSKYIVKWESELVTDCVKKPIVTALYWSYLPDGTKEFKASISAALGYSRLFFEDDEGALKFFMQSLEFDPDNIKVKFECYLLENRMNSINRSINELKHMIR